MVKVGDYLNMLGENGKDWYGEVVGVTPEGYEVYFIEEKTPGVWGYSKEWHEVPKECVQIHIKTEGVVRALKELGFRPLTDNTFARLDETREVPIGEDYEAMEESAGDPRLHGYEDDGFVVPDDEPFSMAAPDSQFVRDTHKAVRDYNKWQPEGEGAKIKQFMEELDHKVIREESEKHKLGECPPFTKPPMHA